MKKLIDIELHKVTGLAQSRREFLQLMGAGLAFGTVASTLPGCSSGSDGTGSNPGSTAAIIPDASREYTALKRTSFGVHRDEMLTIDSIGVSAYLEQQLDHLSVDDGTLEADLQSQFPLLYQTPEELYAGFPGNIASVVQQAVAAVQYRQMFSRRQLYEVMVEFWTDHFNIQLLNGLCPTLKPADDAGVIRAHALGNFRDLLHASARSPAMLFYLDNFSNQASAPNENYARELMELHTLGVDGGYTEQDIKEVARCFTGWSIHFTGDPDGDYGTFNYIDAIHDSGLKTVLGEDIPAGGGQSDANQVLDLLAAHASTAQFVATKLCRRFIADTPAQNTIDEVANAFTQSSGDIKDTLRALFASDAFTNSADLKFTRPSEYVASLIRALAPDTTYPTDGGQLFYYSQAILGQLPYNWPTPDGYPDQQSYWESTGGLLNRWRLSFISYAEFIPEIDVIDIDYLPMLNGANTLASVVDAMINNILMRPVSSVDRDHILVWLEDEHGIARDTALSSGIPEQVAPAVAAVLVSSAYFQLR
ncbi:MAG: DUF1800 domain-containing protein [Pseudomonadales bacterium]|nr:DUF1800 domain-containing protein [Pseudomonadales bacterium]